MSMLTMHIITIMSNINSSLTVFYRLGFTGLASMCLAACSQPNTQDEPVFTQLNELLKNSQSPCKAALLAVGNDLIGNKTHFLQQVTVPANTSEDAKKEHISDAENAISTKIQPAKTPASQLSAKKHIRLSGVLNYHDRPSHARFSAYPQGKSCLVNYQLDYQLNIPCVAAREEAFGKWLHKGKLGEKTNYYVHKRKPNKSAYLTSIQRDVQCMVSVQYNAQARMD